MCLPVFNRSPSRSRRCFLEAVKWARKCTSIGSRYQSRHYGQCSWPTARSLSMRASLSSSSVGRPPHLRRSRSRSRYSILTTSAVSPSLLYALFHGTHSPRDARRADLLQFTALNASAALSQVDPRLCASPVIRSPGLSTLPSIQPQD